MSARQPTKLQPGDSIGITAPAGTIGLYEIEDAIKILESWGLNVQIGKTIDKKWHVFAGTDEERLQDLQDQLDDPSLKAILMARGGYGLGRIIDRLDFNKFTKSPKWIIGYSDITSLHIRLFKIGIQSIHANMAKHLHYLASGKSTDDLKSILLGKPNELIFEDTINNALGECSGTLVGGNLSILCHELGSGKEVDFRGSILVLEDVDEYAFRIDRLLLQLLRKGVFNQINGLIIGQFTGINEQERFGMSVEEMVLNYCHEQTYPIAFHAPIGHITDNMPFVHNARVTLQVKTTGVHIQYH